MKTQVTIDGLESFIAEIDDTGTETVRALRQSLPIRGEVRRWGDEIYFHVDFRAPLEEGARADMKVGEIAYWPAGPALAIFFGPTPASRGREPRAASECNVIGRVLADPSMLRMARDGAEIILRQIDSGKT